MGQTTRKCVVDGCGKKHKARGFCSKHYDYMKQKGTLPEQKMCLVDSCGKPRDGKGLCAKHYARLKTNGDPLHESSVVTARRLTNEQRFWSRVNVRSPKECWPWQGGKFDDGYGSFSLGRGSPKKTKSRSQRAHRYALEIKLGRSISEGMLSCHTCDNPICVNPAHLYEGTPRTNMHDAQSRNRLHKGERVGTDRRKLTEKQVVEMRELRHIGASLRDLVDIYDVGLSTVGRIVSGEGWRHAPGPITHRRARFGDRIIVNGKRVRPNQQSE